MSVTTCFIYCLILNHFRQGLSLHSFFVVRYNQECLDQDYNMTEQNIKYIMCECMLTFTCIRDICTIGKFIFKILMFILIDHSTVANKLSHQCTSTPQVFIYCSRLSQISLHIYLYTHSCHDNYLVPFSDMFRIYLLSIFSLTGKISSYLFGKTKQAFLHMGINMMLHNCKLKSCFKIMF